MSAAVVGHYWHQVALTMRDATPLINLRTALSDTIREVVERSDMMALDSKADREALIRDLIEALC